MPDLLERFADEVRADPELGPIIALVPQGRPLGMLDLLTLGPRALATFSDRAAAIRLLDAVGGAYNRAREGPQEGS
jgi:hypothetical protein